MKLLLLLGTPALALGLAAAGSTGSSSAPAAAAAPAGAAEATTYAVDSGHTSVVFRTRHLGVAYFYGRFDDTSGTITFDPDDPAASSVELVVDAASVSTADERRDDHLRSGDFLSAEEFPEIRFQSTKVVETDDDAYEVTGDLTLRGTTEEITVDAELVGEGPDPWGGHRIGFELEFEIDPVDYGVRWMAQNEGALGPEVRLIVSVEAVRE